MYKLTITGTLEIDEHDAEILEVLQGKYGEDDQHEVAMQELYEFCENVKVTIEKLSSNTYHKKPETVEAIQFNYIDSIDGPKTCELAKSLGLTRRGSTLLWELKTYQGWRIVRSGFWIITDILGSKFLRNADAFEREYVADEGRSI